MKELFAALSAAQDEFPTMKGDAKNPHFSSKYITLEAAIETLQPILRKHSLMIFQPASGNGVGTGCKTILVHTATGQFYEETLLLPSNAPGKDTANAQSGAAAVTYARRIGYLSILGIIQNDDDGNSAVGRTTAKKTADKEPAKTADAEPSVYPTEEEYQAFRERGQLLKGYLEKAGVASPGAKLGAFFLAQAKVDKLSLIPKLTYNMLLKSMELLLTDPKRVPEAVKLMNEVKIG